MSTFQIHIPSLIHVAQVIATFSWKKKEFHKFIAIAVVMIWGMEENGKWEQTGSRDFTKTMLSTKGN